MPAPKSTVQVGPSTHLQAEGGAPAVAGFGERQVVSRWFIVALSGEGTKKVIANEVVANEEGAGPRQCAAHQFVPLLDPELLQGS